MKSASGGLLLWGAISLIPNIAFSESLLPLDEVVRRGTEESYRIVRCAAYYTSLAEWAGPQIDRASYDRIKNAVDSLLIAASLVRSRSSTDDIAHIGQIVLLDARAIADLYLENFRHNYASTGNAWVGNTVFEKDSSACEPIAQAAIMVVNELGGSGQ